MRRWLNSKFNAKFAASHLLTADFSIVPVRPRLTFSPILVVWPLKRREGCRRRSLLRRFVFSRYFLIDETVINSKFNARLTDS
jgi:hypothetical protein